MSVAALGRQCRARYAEAGHTGAVSTVVVLADDRPIDVANDVAAEFPNAKIHVLTNRLVDLADSGRAGPHVWLEICPTVRRMHGYLLEHRPPQVIVDAGSRTAAERWTLFKELFLHLEDGGVYASDPGVGADSPNGEDVAVDDLAEQLGQLTASRPVSAVAVADADAVPLPDADAVPPPDARASELAGVGTVVRAGGQTFVTKIGVHHAKLPEARATTILSNRFGASWGKVLVQGRPTSFTSRAVFTTNRPQFDDRFRNEMEIPARVLREYRNVTCWPRQAVVLDNLVLPNSFHHPWAGRLRNRAMVDVSAQFAATPAASAAPELLAGPYFHLASEFPGHYGHFTTEDIAKLWGWPEAIRRHPDLRVLLGTTDAGGGATSFQLAVLGAFGIPASRITVIDQPVRVELLVGASQLFHNPLYVDPGLDEVWRQLSAALAEPGTGRPARLFVARPAGGLRSCRNGDEVEALFASHGFQIVHPERLALGEQVALFAAAEVVAGYAGSGLFNAMYSRSPGVRIVIAPETYYASNEYLISAVKGDRIHYLWCDPIDSPLDGRYTMATFHSDFTFDFGRDGPELEALLRSL